MLCLAKLDSDGHGDWQCFTTVTNAFTTVSDHWLAVILNAGTVGDIEISCNLIRLLLCSAGLHLWRMWYLLFS